MSYFIIKCEQDEQEGNEALWQINFTSSEETLQHGRNMLCARLYTVYALQNKSATSVSHPYRSHMKTMMKGNKMYYSILKCDF